MVLLNGYLLIYWCPNGIQLCVYRKYITEREREDELVTTNYLLYFLTTLIIYVMNKTYNNKKCK